MVLSTVEADGGWQSEDGRGSAVEGGRLEVVVLDREQGQMATLRPPNAERQKHEGLARGLPFGVRRPEGDHLNAARGLIREHRPEVSLFNPPRFEVCVCVSLGCHGT